MKYPDTIKKMETTNLLQDVVNGGEALSMDEARTLMTALLKGEFGEASM